jgi:hypothetical protein
MIEKNVLFFFDINGFDRDVEGIEFLFPTFKERDDLDVHAKFVNNPVEFKNLLPSYKLAFIDYGGCGYGTLESLSRYFYRLAEDNPNKTFCWLLTMGKEWYGGEDLFENLSNVKSLDNGDLFEKMADVIKEYA